MRDLCLLLIVLGAVILTGLAAPAALADRQDHDAADRVYEKYKDRNGRKGGERREKEAPTMRVSLDQAVNKVRRQVKGKVIGARTERRGNSITHRVKVLQDNGQVRTFSVDGVSGKMR